MVISFPNKVFPIIIKKRLFCIYWPHSRLSCKLQKGTKCYMACRLAWLLINNSAPPRVRTRRIHTNAQRHRHTNISIPRPFLPAYCWFDCRQFCAGLDSFVNVRHANSLQSIIGYLITTIARLEFNIIGRLSFAMLHGVHATSHYSTVYCFNN